MTTQEVLIHFTGMATMGALLIRGCAGWAKYHYLKEQDHDSQLEN